MNVGIVGLGLIGGSLARAYAKAGHKVLCDEKDSSIFEFAMLSGVAQGELNKDTIADCDLILIAIFAQGAIDWLSENGHYISPNALVIDCCGIKTEVCNQCFPLADKYGFTFIGGHPMAGSHNSGFKYSRSNLFQGAPMVLVPPRFDDPELLQRAENALSPCGFKSYSITTAQEHDEMIAFTSQMPHLLSNAYIKSPTALTHSGFSAGSYKDLTRVAWLNPQMWSELFLSNRENILNELSYYIDSLEQYRKAIAENDSDTLIALLDEGRKRKEEVDG